jgi:large subunit ribosomal protein L18
MGKDVEKSLARIKRAKRVRFKVRGTLERPRLSVFRSNKNIYAQIIDDTGGITLVSASTVDKEFKRKAGDPFNKETAHAVGKLLAERAKDKSIERVVFDRGPYLFHGKVKALAEGAREGGLAF